MKDEVDEEPIFIKIFESKDIKESNRMKSALLLLSRFPVDGAVDLFHDPHK